MDPFTAATSTMAVQLAVAIIMAGTFYASPSERAIRYWALSGLLSAIGVLVVIINAGAPKLVLSVAGNGAVIAGMVMQWWGVRVFYRKQPHMLGWIVLAGFTVLFAFSMATNRPLAGRALLSALTMTLLALLNVLELWRSRRPGPSFAALLAFIAALVSTAAFAARAIGILQNNPQFFPGTAADVGVIVVYMIPMVSTLLFAMALLLLYFERMVAEKHQMASYDELTGLYNRRAIVAAGKREIAVAQRLCRPLAVAYIDIDHFKKINDQLGHDAGDHVITDIGQVLKEGCRNIDIVGRYGGEEFCIIFPGMDREGVTMLAERLLGEVRRYRFRDNMAVTVSMGFAVLEPDEQERSWTGLMQRADALLYQAKSAGRNRYCI